MDSENICTTNTSITCICLNIQYNYFPKVIFLNYKSNFSASFTSTDSHKTPQLLAHLI